MGKYFHDANSWEMCVKKEANNAFKQETVLILNIRCVLTALQKCVK